VSIEEEEEEEEEEETKKKTKISVCSKSVIKDN
jgi:hypothetical protein